MKIVDYGLFRVLFAGMVAVAFVLSAIGMIDIAPTPYSGYKLSPDYKIIRIEPNSPASMAGLKEGDAVIEIGGIPTENLHQLSKQARPKIGEETKMAVMRQGVWREFRVQPTALPTKELVLAWAGNFLAFIMLAFGLAVYWRWSDKPSSLFFLSNFCFALALMTPPYFESFFWRNIVAINSLFLVTMGLAFFLHLTLIFPRPKGLVRDTALVEPLVYLPAPLMVIAYLALGLFEPRADLLVNLVLHNVFALLVGACLILALAAVIHSYWTATSLERTRGLTAVLLGSLLGVIPPAAAFLLEIFLPHITLPGREYYPLLAVLVPLSFGWALWKINAPEEFGELPRAA